MSALASGEFWAFVGVVAGIYTIFALGLQLQFGFAGLLNFGQVAFMAIGAYTMAILVVKEGWSTWLAAPLGVAVAAAAGLLLGLPALRLRADYFAIVTIAFSEIVRYVATNQDSLTGGSQGTIALGEVGRGGAVQRPVGAIPGARPGLARRLLEGRRDARDRLGDGDRAARAASGSRCARPGAACCARSARTRTPRRRSGRTCSRTSSRRSRSAPALAGIAGCFYAWQFSFFSPDDFQPLLTFFAWMIVILGGLGRIWAVPVGAVVFGFLFAGTRFLDFPPLSYLSGADRAYVRLIVIGLVIIGLVLVRPQGILGKRDEMVLE